MRRWLALLCCVLFAAACSPWREVQRPWTTKTLNGWRTARATLHDGRVVMLDAARITRQGDELMLCGTPADDDAGAPHQVALRDVARIERGQPGLGEFLLGELVTIGTGVAIIAIAAL